MEEYEKVLNELKKYHQEHLLAFYNELNEQEKKRLLNQIESIDFELMEQLYQKAISDNKVTYENLVPIQAFDIKNISNEEQKKLEKLGIETIVAGEYAVVIMAGGQGTRLGHNGPKGTFMLDDKNELSLFEIFVNSLKEAHEKYGTWINCYIMTSRENNSATVDFFEKHEYFGYPKANITFFVQGELPMVLTTGKIVLESKDRVKLAADGHGGIIVAMNKSHIIEDMKQKGIKYVFMGAVDNCLLKLVDTKYIGYAVKNNGMAIAKTLKKQYPEEKIGVFCTSNGIPCVVEYTEIPQELMTLTDNKGELLYSESHVMMNMFNIDALERMHDVKLPYHVAYKKTNYIDENGTEIIADSPNAYKFEAFIFDAYTVLKKALLYRGNREEEFAPLKNKEGLDSIDTARKLYYEYISRRNNV